MVDWIPAGDVFLSLAAHVGEDRAKQILLNRFHSGLLVAKITRFVTETNADIFSADLDAYNAERREKWSTRVGPYTDYKFPEFAFSAEDNLIRDKDDLPAWLTWNHLKALPDIWTALYQHHSYRADWHSGEFASRYYYRKPQSEHDNGDYTDTFAAGVMFRADLIEIIPEWRLRKAQKPVQEKAANLGGRPAQSHGDTISQVTLRLASLSPQELKRHTAASVADDLQREYNEIGEHPPSLRSAELYAAGILRALRTRKT